MSLFSSFLDIFKYSKFFTYLDSIAGIAADVTDSDSTKDKAADVLEDLIKVAEPLITAANPALGAEVGLLATALIAELQKLTDAAVTPTPTPTPTPAPSDPTAVAYATLEEAKAALTIQDSTVRQFPDGSFHVWPLISGPGTQVYP